MTERAVTEDGVEGRAADKRILSVGVGATIAVILLALALVFANAFGATRVAENARALHWTNATLGAAAIARASNAQAVVFAVDSDLDVVAPETAAAALSEARINLAALEQWRAKGAEQADQTPGLTASLTTLVATAGEVLDLIDAGELAVASELNRTEFEAAYAAASADLEAAQDEILLRIDDTEAVAGRIGLVTRVAVTLMIPGAAIVIYRVLVRRQARRREQKLQAKLAVERELHRAKDEFIAGISHEIRTPLTSIYGFSEILVDQGLIDPDTSMELIALINTESAELSRMVEDLLTAARLEAEAMNFTFAPLAAPEELEMVIAPFERSGHNVTWTCPDVPVWADQMRLHQIIRNLLSNAVKHGGPTVTVGGGRDGASFVCTVTDDGAGIPAEYEDRLFQRFVHGGNEPLLVGSVGLGLAVASSLADAMGGSLDYERTQGETRFIVRLPAERPVDAAATRAGDQLTHVG